MNIIGLVDSSGNTVVSYSYDSWGKILGITGSMAATLGADNPFRYKGYYYDEETSLYYIQSRYYNPEICRFISADDVSLLSASPMALTDKNLYAYCDNNPVVRRDAVGKFWETAFDVLSLGASIVEVAINPADPLAWAALVGDTIDLLPFVTGVGEATKVIGTTIRTADNAQDIIKTAKTIDLAKDIRKGFGSYEVFYDTGISYVGKGGFDRAIRSAIEHKKEGNLTAIRWKSAPSAMEAFIDEYMMQCRRIEKIHNGKFSTAKKKLCNAIWSPGKKYYFKKYNQFLK